MPSVSVRVQTSLIGMPRCFTKPGRDRVLLGEQGPGYCPYQSYYSPLVADPVSYTSLSLLPVLEYCLGIVPSRKVLMQLGVPFWGSHSWGPRGGPAQGGPFGVPALVGGSHWRGQVQRARPHTNQLVPVLVGPGGPILTGPVSLTCLVRMGGPILEAHLA